jgi:glucan phosphoethanolaminetransferase (alkaline phosphatase superfamily)
MITEKEKQFIVYWEAERENRAKFSNKIISGLPMAFLFGLPIILSIAVVYLFFPEWYTKVSNMPKGILPTIFLAVILCILFFSYFRMQYKWEMNEQLYQELKAKQKKE